MVFTNFTAFHKRNWVFFGIPYVAHQAIILCWSLALETSLVTGQALSLDGTVVPDHASHALCSIGAGETILEFADFADTVPVDNFAGADLFDEALEGAAIKVNEVSVVALFSTFEDSVAAFNRICASAPGTSSVCTNTFD
jgi:hypothetical protein